MISSNESDKLLLFMHIPKTGGQTLRGFIKKQYNFNETYRCPFMEEKIVELSKDFRNSLKFIYGHFLFGTHEHFPKKFTYISFMRDPVDRFISAYYHILRHPTNRLHERVKSLSLEEFIDSDDFNLQTEPNIQTRFFCGKDPMSLEIAKKNISEHFSVVGITELFGESLFFMKKLFGWNNIDYEKRNVGTNRPQKMKISKELIAKIKLKNQIDMELYQFARKKLEEQINALDPQTKREMEIFKKDIVSNDG